MLKRGRLMRLCDGMFITGVLGLEILGIAIVFYQNILMGIAFSLLGLMANAVILRTYLYCLKED